MSAASDALEVDGLNGILNTVSGVWIALSTADPLDTGAGLSEPIGGNYSRVNVISGFTVTSGAGTAKNTAAIQFPTPSASWGNIGWFAICSGASGANIRIHNALSSVQSVPSGVVVKFLASGLTVTIA